MEELISKLEEILENEALLYTQILNIGNQKTDIIIKGKVNELAVLVEQEQDIVSKLAKLEFERDHVSTALHKELKLTDEEVTLTQLVKHIEGKNADSLIERQNKLLDVLKQVKNVNDQNGKLINSSLEYIEFSINVLSSAVNPGNNYNQVGYTGAVGKSSLFDKKL